MMHGLGEQEVVERVPFPAQSHPADRVAVPKQRFGDVGEIVVSGQPQPQLVVLRIPKVTSIAAGVRTRERRSTTDGWYKRFCRWSNRPTSRGVVGSSTRRSACGRAPCARPKSPQQQPRGGRPGKRIGRAVGREAKHHPDPFEERARCAPARDPRSRSRQARRCARADQDDPRVAARVFAGQRCGTVGGRVVEDEKFEVRIVLREDRVDGFAERCFAVIHREQKGRAHACSACHIAVIPSSISTSARQPKALRPSLRRARSSEAIELRLLESRPARSARRGPSLGR